MVAVNNNRSSRIVQSLISNKAGVNLQNDDGMTALMIAARDAPALIENLISNGADETVRDKTGRTALMYAVDCKDRKENHGREVIAALCGSGIDKTTSCGQTALMRSVHCSQTVKYLLELGANPCLVDNQGFNALDAAILGCSSESSLETVQILVGSQVHVPLPTHPFYEMVVRCLLENKQVNGECCACFEVIDSNGVQLRCQHLLHTDCLERWHKNCQQKTTCPYCRRLVSFL
jgi:ankyrin repeat protein